MNHENNTHSIRLIESGTSTVIRKYDCDHEGHIDFHLKEKIRVNPGDDLLLFFDRTIKQMVSRLKLLTLYENKSEEFRISRLGKPYKKLVIIPDDIESLGCPDGHVCKHYHVFPEGVTAERIELVFRPASSRPGYPDMWWLIGVSVDFLPLELVDLGSERSCGDRGKRVGPYMRSHTQSPLKKIKHSCEDVEKRTGPYMGSYAQPPLKKVKHEKDGKEKLEKDGKEKLEKDEKD